MANTIKVGCRHMSGLHLRTSEWVDNPADPNGAKVLRETGIYELKGANQEAPAGREYRGYGVTEVPADAFKAWFDLNKNDDLVTTGTVFKYEGSDEEKADKDIAKSTDVLNEAQAKADDLKQKQADKVAEASSAPQTEAVTVKDDTSAKGTKAKAA